MKIRPLSNPSTPSTRQTRQIAELTELTELTELAEIAELTEIAELAELAELLVLLVLLVLFVQLRRASTTSGRSWSCSSGQGSLAALHTFDTFRIQGYQLPIAEEIRLSSVRWSRPHSPPQQLRVLCTEADLSISRGVGSFARFRQIVQDRNHVRYPDLCAFFPFFHDVSCGSRGRRLSL